MNRKNDPNPCAYSRNTVRPYCPCGKLGTHEVFNRLNDFVGHRCAAHAYTLIVELDRKAALIDCAN